MAKVYEAVTLDNVETDIKNVKIKETSEITSADLVIIAKHCPDFTVPESKMYRLSIIDEEIQKLMDEKHKIEQQLIDKNKFREKIEAEAKKVVLKKQGEIIEELIIK